MLKTLSAGVLVLVLAAASAALQPAVQAPVREPDVPYEPTPPEVVTVMLEMARIHSGDIVYDLGCGDGRIVIAAVKKTPGVRGVCVDIDPRRIEESRQNAAAAGVARRIEFRTQDLFEARFDDATVVMLFLWPEINLKLRPKLRGLKPGTRIVSHWHDMGDWKADWTMTATGYARPRPVYLWVIPAHSGPPGTF